MTDDWTWDDDGHGPHDDPAGFDGVGDHHDHFGYDGGDDYDAAGGYGGPGDDHGGFDDLSGGDLSSGDGLSAGDHLAGHDDPAGFGADDPFAPDALVSDHHNWAAGLDEDGTDGLGPIDATHLFGTDPDVSAYTDALWPTPEFPAALDLGAALPEPIDGAPWTDPASLGVAGPADLVAGDAPEPADLAAYAGLDPASSGWEALVGSEDPATSALARFWGPPLA
ncbi:hypothetical protein [Asanoa siamensis]|uniref:Uncharacterized protein n=1 Tax=Asanoa siamensis TaxID=926357 RepID=A0ABQ4CYN3_9ACTN|nr:hypothetical protein [Asanoa siamensis]GIF76133.1 hypothetical protein Asi02nite_56510 [Asanoa siamensis]